MSKDELSPVRYSGDATNIDDDDQSGTDDDNATNAKVVTNRDLFLYFFLGATTKLIQGLSLTPTFIKAVHVTGPQMPQTGLAFSIGAVLGMVIVATVYPKLRPKIRIFFSGSLQFIGVIILALPVPPVNWWLGLIVLAMVRHVVCSLYYFCFPYDGDGSTCNTDAKYYTQRDAFFYFLFFFLFRKYLMHPQPLPLLLLIPPMLLMLLMPMLMLMLMLMPHNLPYVLNRCIINNLISRTHTRNRVWVRWLVLSCLLHRMQLPKQPRHFR